VQHPGTPRKLREESGFTLIEVLVAATLLIIGVFATLALLDTSTKATATSKQRDVANAIGQELIERAQGGRYSLTRNDMTDVDPASPTPGPADRLRAGMDPDGTSASTAVTPATVTSGSVPNLTPQSWTLRRQNTTYTVSYRACTLSDAYQQVVISGPYDCARTATAPVPAETATSSGCPLGVALDSGTSNPTALVHLQVLGILGVSVCLGDTLSTALCAVLGTSPILSNLTQTLLGTGGLLTGLLGAVNSGATLAGCPPAQVDVNLTGARGGIATSTRLSVTVAWQDFSGRQQSASQTAVVRRAAG
jgi:Tfp pilus assembly protein PilV